MPNFPPNYAEQEKFYASEEYQTGAKAAIANNQPLPTFENPNPVSNSNVTSQPPRTSKKRGGILRYPMEALTGTTDYLQIDIEKYEAIGSNYITSTGSDDRYVIGNARQNRAGRVSSSKLTKKPLDFILFKTCFNKILDLIFLNFLLLSENIWPISPI